MIIDEQPFTIAFPSTGHCYTDSCLQEVQHYTRRILLHTLQHALLLITSCKDMTVIMALAFGHLDDEELRFLWADDAWVQCCGP